MSVDCECVVVGAGVVGLAIAAELAQQGREVLVLDAEDSVGSVTSARNSEVVHAGIYYEPGSLKAQYCVQGKQLLYTYCQQRQIPHSQCGKLIVATSPSQQVQLTQIRQRAEINGVHDLHLLSAGDAKSMEPQLECVAALLSPSTGIVDSHALMLSLQGDAENHGATVVCGTTVDSLIYNPEQGCFEISTLGEDAMTFTASLVVNSAGHGACALANSAGNLSRAIAEPVMYKGNYFSLAGKSPFSRLVYPVPEEAGLGVHLTIDLAGRARFGPDVEPVAQECYEVDPQRSESFYSAIRRYWPSLPDNSLFPDYAGIRPRVRFNDTLHSDFFIQGPDLHGLPGLINLMGIESPGLTASMAIAKGVSHTVNRASKTQ